MPIHVRPRWWLPEGAVTPESAWLDRRRFARALGLGAIAAALPACSDTPNDGPDSPLETTPSTATTGLYPPPRNPAYVADRPLTAERVAASYNNFYEMTTDKSAVWRVSGTLTIRPWTVEFAGHCARRGPIDFEALLHQMPLEQRVYRFRCVEAWAMVVPWSGFPLAKLVEWAQPTAGATHVRMITAERAGEMPGVVAQPWLPWPYHEGLSLAEARNPLAFIATGIYGRELPRQHGAPLRLVAPWKYGYKNIKSIVRFEFTNSAPPTFWNSLAPAEYDFAGNVDPRIPHPRWSQSTERMIGTGERRPTLLYNGYGPEVAALYRG